jgi:hypothetical protein
MDTYGYCYQNPLKFIDPTGMSAEDPPPNANEELLSIGFWVDDSGAWQWDEDQQVWSGIDGTNYDVEYDRGRITYLEGVEVTAKAPDFLDKVMSFLSSNNPFSRTSSDTFYHVTGGAGLGSGGGNSFRRFDDTVVDVDFSELSSMGRSTSPSFTDFLRDAFSLGGTLNIKKEIDYKTKDTTIYTMKYEIDSRRDVVDSTFGTYRTNKNIFRLKNVFRNPDKWTNKITMDEIPDSLKIKIK